MTKNIKFVITTFVFFELKMHQNPFSTPPGELTKVTTLPQTRVGWGDTPSPFPSPLDNFGVSLRPPQHKILATPVQSVR